ncbi:MAG TPA: proline--tRNA ligase [Anaerolineae bacterium]|nr:proline--tRNA ligase [Anaerolineae bacterium]HNU05607.1 proline--tRNA ligase [Anaerolineae bacterium]
MRLSHAFFQTLRDAPADAELISHKLLLRAGFIQPLGAGIYSYLPLARRSMDKIEAIIRQEMNAIGGQELTMPVVHPGDLWQQTERWDAAYPELVHWRDRAGRDMTLAMTHEEVVADLARRQISSWRQLPQMIYHIQIKFRDEPRSRGGLIRVREFTMKDSYSLDADEAGLERQFEAHRLAYRRIFQRCGLETVEVSADVGMMGGSKSVEFMALTPAGEDTLLLCASCGYAANREVATFRKPAPSEETPLPAEKVATPHCKTIAELAAFLGVPESRTAKAVFFAAEGGKVIFAITRGDMEVNETKLRQAAQATALRPATEEEIRAVGAVPGYGSPVGVAGALVVVDELVAASPNLAAGANAEGYHLLNVTCGRDYQPDIVADIVAAQGGEPCPACGSPLQAERGVEVGNIFKLGTRYSEVLGALYDDPQGVKRPIVMGSYGIGVGRLLATVAETRHDPQGLIWPASIAPFQVHLVLLPKKAPQAVDAADRLYAELTAAGFEVLYDDREEPSPGVKFADADLIGLPLRITVSARSLEQGGVELKRRDQDERRIAALEDLPALLRAELAA